MQWIEAKVVFESPGLGFAEDLITGVFYVLGVRGVLIENRDHKFWNGAEDRLPAMPKTDAVIGFFPEKSYRAGCCRRLEKKLGRLQKEFGICTRVSYRMIDEQNWAENWKAFFRPEKIGERIIVKPSWHEFQAGPEDIVLQIDPGMAFGTGTHSTTILCVRMIEKFLRKGDKFLDVGTGSGILMAAAAKLGAGKVCGVDMDPAAVQIAQNNLLQNAVEQKRFHVVHGNLLENIHESFDMIAANLTVTSVLDLLENMGGKLRPAGIFICSGIVDEQTERVAGHMKHQGFDLLEISRQEQWSAIAGRFKRTESANFDLDTSSIRCSRGTAFPAEAKGLQTRRQRRELPVIYLARNLL